MLENDNKKAAARAKTTDGWGRKAKPTPTHTSPLHSTRFAAIKLKLAY